MNNKRNKIPSITEDRIDNNVELGSKPTTAKDKEIQSFLKGKESTQAFTTRIPKELYNKFRKMAFDKDIKMNQVVVQLIRNYVIEKTE
jgi:hypothetical protein